MMSRRAAFAAPLALGMQPAWAEPLGDWLGRRVEGFLEKRGGAETDESIGRSADRILERRLREPPARATVISAAKTIDDVLGTLTTFGNALHALGQFFDMTADDGSVDAIVAAIQAIPDAVRQVIALRGIQFQAAVQIVTRRANPAASPDWIAAAGETVRPTLDLAMLSLPAAAFVSAPACAAALRQRLTLFATDPNQPAPAIRVPVNGAVWTADCRELANFAAAYVYRDQPARRVGAAERKRRAALTRHRLRTALIVARTILRLISES